MKNDDMISRAALLNEFRSLCGPQTGDGWDNMGVHNLIMRQKAVDAAPVIRCRDCKHSIENAKHLDMACERSYDPDFYCAAGERKDSE